MESIEVIVARRALESEQVVSLELTRADGLPLPPYSAGAHIDVHLPGGLVRQYSLCGGGDSDGRYVIAVLLETNSRGGSVAVHALQEGATLQISKPRNHFPLEPAQHYVLLAGGIGITPIIAMADQLARNAASFEIHYCARSSSQAAFLTRLTKGCYSHRVHVHFDDGDPKQKLDLTRVLGMAGGDGHVYVCGPAGFICHVESMAAEMGLNQRQLHREYFKPVAVDTKGDQAFSITLVRSRRQFHVPADRTALQVLQEHGVEIPASCEQGVCGTCVTRVLSGIPDHRDMYFTDQEHLANNQFTPCCSRAKSATLMLDL